MSISDLLNQPPVIAAIIALFGVIITATVTFLTPIGTFLFTKYFEGRLFDPISVQRRDAVRGLWVGTIQQNYLGEQKSYPGELDLEVKGKNLTGTLRIPPPPPCDMTQRISFTVKGGFLFERFARIEYNSTSKGSVYFGSMIVELNPEGTKFNGYWVAFGAFSKEVICGSINLDKQRP